MLEQEQIVSLIGQPLKNLYHNNAKFPSIYTLILDKHSLFNIKSQMDNLPVSEVDIKQLLIKLIEQGKIEDISTSRNNALFTISFIYKNTKYNTKIKMGPFSWVFNNIENKGKISIPTAEKKVTTTEVPKKNKKVTIKKLLAPFVISTAVVVSGFLLSIQDFSIQIDSNNHGSASNKESDEKIEEPNIQSKEDTEVVKETESEKELIDDSSELVKTNLLTDESEEVKETEITMEDIEEVLKEEGYVIVKEEELVEIQRMAKEYQNMKDEMQKIEQIKTAVNELLDDTNNTEVNKQDEKKVESEDTTKKKVENKKEDKPKEEVKNISFEIKKGMTSKEVANILVDKGFAKNQEEVLKLFTKHDVHSKIVFGKYTFSSTKSLDEIVQYISK